MSKYEVGDKVKFTDENGKKISGVIHGVRYQEDEKNQRHSFEYIIVPETEHKQWWNTENGNQKHIKAKNHHLVKPLPDMCQYIRIDTDLE